MLAGRQQAGIGLKKRRTRFFGFAFCSFASCGNSRMTQGWSRKVVAHVFLRSACRKLNKVGQQKRAQGDGQAASGPCSQRQLCRVQGILPFVLKQHGWFARARLDSGSCARFFHDRGRGFSFPHAGGDLPQTGAFATVHGVHGEQFDRRKQNVCSGASATTGGRRVAR